jgi:hypothetical protein
MWNFLSRSIGCDLNQQVSYRMEGSALIQDRTGLDLTVESSPTRKFNLELLERQCSPIPNKKVYIVISKQVWWCVVSSRAIPCTGDTSGKS